MAEKQAGNKARHLKLHQWQPGQSGNPRGRPRRTACVTDALRAHGHGRLRLASGRMGTRAQALAEALWELALGDGGDSMAATRIILDRLEGRVQEIELPEDPRRIVVTPIAEPGLPAAPPAEDADECPT